MTTRDSKAWIVAVIGAQFASLAQNPQLVEKLIERDRATWISVLCQFFSIAAAAMMASPLPISEDGRRKYTSDTVKLK